MQRAHLIDIGRLNVVRAFLKGKYGVNLGSGLIRFENKINVDFTKEKADPDILWDLNVFPYPFKDCVFEEVVFTEVMEHLNAGTEVRALREIERMLKPGGLLVMSVPNDNFVSKLLDPVYWSKGHRHYSEKQMRELFKQTNLKIKHVFSSGTIPFGVVTFSYAVNWLLRRKKADLFKDIVTNSFNNALASKAGGTLFVIAEKEG